MITPSVAHDVAAEAIRPIAVVMVGEYRVGRCRLGRSLHTARCNGRVYGAYQDIRLKVRMRERRDGTIGFAVCDIVDVTPTPDPAPRRP